MGRFTASALQRIAACPASAVLPSITRDGQAASRGTEIHAYLAALSEGVDEAVALAKVPDEFQAVCQALPNPGPGIVEPAFALDVRSGLAREIGRNIGRDYGKLAFTELAGSADLVRVEPGHVLVRDYKTGRTEVAPPEMNLQLGFLAVCACKVYGRARAVVEIVTIFEDGGSHTESAALDSFALAAIMARVRSTFDAVEKAAAALQRSEQPKLHEGAHCKYCPARAACPAKVGLIQRLAGPAVVREEFRGLLNAQTAAQAYEMVERAAELVADLRAQLYQWAQENPISLPDGKVFGPVDVERESLLGNVAFRVLSELHGADIALAACELSTTKTAIEKALRPRAAKGQLAAMKRAALKAIEAAGGVETTTKSAVKEHWPVKVSNHKEQ